VRSRLGSAITRSDGLIPRLKGAKNK
jgi:hypothetical protein